jgi:hypothetical protein
MPGLRVLFVLSLLVLTQCCLFGLDDQKVAHAKYEELAAKVNAGDLNVDWKALRLAARVGEVYGNYDPYDAARRAQEAFQKRDCEGVLKIARETLRHNVADGDAHAAAWSCLKQLGRQSEADREWNVLQALLQSILKSGDGKSIESAWFVVGLKEEFLTLGALQIQSKEQHSVKQGGHYYSRVVVTDETGKDSVVYFNIDTDIEMGNRAGEGHYLY